MADAQTQDFITRTQKLAEEMSALAADAGQVVADAANTHADYYFMNGLTVLILACFVGYYVVWRVTPALHSPLMGITNAISSVIIVGAIIAAGPADLSSSKWMGFFAVILASINIFGGFIVTRRVLQMFKKSSPRKTRPDMNTLSDLAYLVSAILFIMALRGLSNPESARNGVLFGMVGMAIAIVTTLLDSVMSPWLIFLGIIIGGSIGTFIAQKISMTALPQLVAAFHSLVGLAAVLVAASAYYDPETYGIGFRDEIAIGSLVEMSLGAAIGAITFTGSCIAFGKLQGIIPGKPITFANQHVINAGISGFLVFLTIMLCTTQAPFFFWAIVTLSLILGILIIIPIGGADMPVIVSMLNSYSGWAAAGIGFTLQNDLLIITGALVGSSGAILSYIMCKGMNRSFFSVVLGGFGAEGASGAGAAQDYSDKQPKIGAPEDAAFIMKNASKVIIVPGYGMAVSQAQHVLREMADALKHGGVEVKYAIHPVAGRMPGHMNVLLAEANVPYDEVFELEDINREFGQADVAFVIGANDITNPAAKNDSSSPIFGMPVLDVEKAKTVFFIKRSLGSGYAGIDNPLFYADNTYMLLGDAKKVTEQVVKTME